MANRLSAARSKLRQKLATEGQRVKLEMLESQRENIVEEMEELSTACRRMEEENAAAAAALGQTGMPGVPKALPGSSWASQQLNGTAMTASRGRGLPQGKLFAPGEHIVTSGGGGGGEGVGNALELAANVGPSSLCTLQQIGSAPLPGRLTSPGTPTGRMGMLPPTHSLSHVHGSRDGGGCHRGGVQRGTPGGMMPLSEAIGGASPDLDVLRR